MQPPSCATADSRTRLAASHAGGARLLLMLRGLDPGWTSRASNVHIEFHAHAHRLQLEVGTLGRLTLEGNRRCAPSSRCRLAKDGAGLEALLESLNEYAGRSPAPNAPSSGFQSERSRDQDSQLLHYPRSSHPTRDREQDDYPARNHEPDTHAAARCIRRLRLMARPSIVSLSAIRAMCPHAPRKRSLRGDVRRQLLRRRIV
jgi:hypothetical protein